ncbi:MAG: peptidylprolyl isomerase [Candidatus Heimdallarchaeota archaeon]
MSKKKKKGDKAPAAIAEGDFILVDYVGRRKDNNELFDVTLEDLAREEGVWREDVAYRPELCIVGQNFLVQGLEKAMIGMEIGKTATIEVQPEEAFGKRDPKLIERIPARALIEETKARPEVGKRVSYKGKVGRIVSAAQGRCRVDFNHPLAGKELVFDVTIHDRIETMEDKLKTLVSRRIPQVPIDEFKLEFDEEAKEAKIDIPFRLLGAERLDYALLGLAADIWRQLGFETIQTTQTFDFKPKETEEETEEQEETEDAEKPTDEGENGEEKPSDEDDS